MPARLKASGTTRFKFKIYNLHNEVEFFRLDFSLDPDRVLNCQLRQTDLA